MALDIKNKNLIVCTSEFLPSPPERDADTVYFVYDKMAVYMGRTFYSDPFCVVENVPSHPAEGMLYITTEGRLMTYIDYEIVDFGGTDNPDYIELIRQAGTVYFMKAEYRYLDLESRCIALPYQNGTYQLSVNLMKCLRINNNTVLKYNEETGHFEVVEGDYADTEFHDTTNFVGVETDTVKTWIDDRQLYADIKISDAPNNAIKLFGNGIFADVSGNISREEFDRLVALYNNYVTTVDSMMEELHQEMQDKGYDTTPGQISELILEALEDYKPTIQSMFENYDVIYEQLGYIREASLDYTDESVQALRQEIFDYLNNITNAWHNYEGETSKTIDEKTLTEEETEYLAEKVESARMDIINARKTDLPDGAPVDLEYMYIGNPFSGQRLTPPKMNATSVYGRDLGTTFIVTYDELPIGHFYYYKLTNQAPKYKDDAVSCGYTRWINNVDIPCEDKVHMMFVETNNTKQIIRYCHLITNSRSEYPRELGVLVVNALKSYDEPGKMVLSVFPELEEGNTYSYGEIDTFPEYDGVLPTGLTPWDGQSPIDLSDDNLKTITLIEHTTNGLVKKVGMFRVNMRYDTVRSLKLTAVHGSENMYTKITVYPQKELSNVYMKAIGTYLPDYDDNLADDPRFSAWDGEAEIECTCYDDNITVVECAPEFGELRAKKTGSARAVVLNTYTPTIEYSKYTYLVDEFIDDNTYKMAYKIVSPGYNNWLDYDTVVPSDFIIVERDATTGNFNVPIVIGKEIAIATVTRNNTVVLYNIVEPVISFALDLQFNFTNINNIVTITSILPDPSIAEDIAKYYYQVLVAPDSRRYIYNEPLNTSDYIEWTEGMQIKIEDPNISTIKLVGVSRNNGVLTVGTASIV